MQQTTVSAPTLKEGRSITRTPGEVHDPLTTPICCSSVARTAQSLKTTLRIAYPTRLQSDELATLKEC